jgi:hypothetical protein
MADTYYDYTADPWNSDATDKIRVQSTEYAGGYADITAPAAVNYPPSAATRLFVTLPHMIDVSDLGGSYPIIIKNVTDAVVLTRVSGSPGSNEYRVPAATSKRRDVIELNADKVSKVIGFDYYGIGSILNAEDFETQLNINGVVRVDDATDASSTTTGSLQTDGGLAVVKKTYLGDSVVMTDDKFIGIAADTDLLQLVAGELNINGSLYLDDDNYIGIDSDRDLIFLQSDVVRINGDLIIAVGGDIGIVSDTDLLTLTSGLVTINGSLKLDDNSNIGIDSDTDLLLLASGLLTINGSLKLDDNSDIGIDSDTNLMELAANALVVNGSIKRGSSGTAFFEKVLTITNWDMAFSVDGAQGYTAAHGISSGASKIYFAKASIISDAGTTVVDFLSGIDLGDTDNNVGRISWDGTNVTLQQADDSMFDNTSFDTTTGTRGYILIWYIA